MKTLILVICALLLSSCSTMTVMKSCKQVNDTEYFFCEHQYKVFR